LFQWWKIEENVAILGVKGEVTAKLVSSSLIVCVCVLEKNTREIVRDFRDRRRGALYRKKEEEGLRDAAPIIGTRASSSNAAVVAADYVRGGDCGVRRRLLAV
jgi:hypothetical protein